MEYPQVFYLMMRYLLPLGNKWPIVSTVIIITLNKLNTNNDYP